MQLTAHNNASSIPFEFEFSSIGPLESTALNFLENFAI
jgi:hypothetical protein